MSLLVDTHVLLWMAEGSAELGQRSKDLLERRAKRDGLAVSAITFWEVAMLCQRGRIRLSKSVAAWRQQVLERSTIRELPVTGAIGVESVELPGDLHGDPGDRLIVATARVAGLQLATRDRRLLDYGGAGYVQAVPI